jgi:hypothetical protein
VDAGTGRRSKAPEHPELGGGDGQDNRTPLQYRKSRRHTTTQGTMHAELSNTALFTGHTFATPCMGRYLMLHGKYSFFLILSVTTFYLGMINCA